MRKKSLIHTIVVLMLLVSFFGTMARPVPAADVRKEEDGTNCFAQFEKCTQNVRTSFLGGTIDYLDCELALIKCIRIAVLGK